MTNRMLYRSSPIFLPVETTKTCKTHKTLIESFLRHENKAVYKLHKKKIVIDLYEEKELSQNFDWGDGKLKTAGLVPVLSILNPHRL